MVCSVNRLLSDEPWLSTERGSLVSPAVILWVGRHLPLTLWAAVSPITFVGNWIPHEKQVALTATFLPASALHSGSRFPYPISTVWGKVSQTAGSDKGWGGGGTSPLLMCFDCPLRAALSEAMGRMVASRTGARCPSQTLAPAPSHQPCLSLVLTHGAVGIKSAEFQKVTDRSVSVIISSQESEEFLFSASDGHILCDPAHALTHSPFLLGR